MTRSPFIFPPPYSKRRIFRLFKAIIIAGCFIVGLSVLSVLSAQYARAADSSVPRPENKQEALDSIKSRMKDEQARKDKLAANAKSIKNDMEQTRKNLADVALSVRRNEAHLNDLNDRIAKLGQEQQDLSLDLKENYGSIASLILALERIRRIPPEALIIKPGAPYETAQTALLLKGTLPAVYNQANELSAKLNRLAEIQKDLKSDRVDSLKTKKNLESKQTEMAALMKKREQLYSRTKRSLSASEKSLGTLAAQAKSMQDLIARLQEENRRARELNRRNERSDPPMPDFGPGVLPVNGRVIMAYGQRDEIGAKSNGLRIESRPSALVTSPIGGIVRYDGPFKNYGNILIIEHKGGYHSLIAGLETVNVHTGQAINAGEPIGKLPKTSSRGGNPTLYYELRYKGETIDPARKLAQIKS